MGILDKLFSGEENKVEIDMNESAGVINVQGFTGFGKTSENVASKISALHAGVGLIADTIASLPVYKYKKESDGSKTKCEDKVNYLLNKNSNDYVSAFNAKQLMLKNAIKNGNGYLWIKRGKGFEIESLVPLTSNECQLVTNDGGETFIYTINKYNKNIKAEYHEVINLTCNSTDGVQGKGILELGSEVLGLENSQQKFLGEIMVNGSYSKGVVYVPKETNSEQKRTIEQKIKGFFSNGNNGKFMTLADNCKYEPISMSPTDIKVLESREFNIIEIANLLKLPAHMLNTKVSSGNYNTLEQSNLQFLQNTLTPYLTQLSQVFSHYLLTEEEKMSGEYEFIFDTSRLLKTTKKDEMEMLDKAISSGVMTVKEVRDELDMPMVENSNILMFSKFGSILKDGELINLQSMTKETEKEMVEEVPLK